MHPEADAPARVLVIEDDPDGRQSVVDALEDAGHAVVAAGTAEAGLRFLRREPFDAVLSDIRLPDQDGIEVLRQARALDADLPVLLMTAYGAIADAVTALKAGAYDYLAKPLNLADLLATVARAVEARRLRTQVTDLRRALAGRPLIAASPAMRAVLDQLRAVAATQATVLILGESGTGKELVARAIHDASPRADGPFVAVNCGAFSETLLESELFGHEKGAFTGALARHAGAFERADGGTLLLDEIGIAPAAVQTRLLRVLEEREILRVGGTQPVPIHVRVLAASNRALDDLVAERSFRHDLLYRLQVVTLALPPLRARPEDIRPLADFFLAESCKAHGRHLAGVRPDYYAALERYAWPGNVRELKHAVEASVILAATPCLTAADLKLGPPPAVPDPPAALALPAGLSLAHLEREAILQALRRHEGSRTLAAEELGLSTRTIQRKIRDYDLPF